jgi:hypothetical protein
MLIFVSRIEKKNLLKNCTRLFQANYPNIYSENTAKTIYGIYIEQLVEISLGSSNKLQCQVIWLRLRSAIDG